MGRLGFCFTFFFPVRFLFPLIVLRVPPLRPPTISSGDADLREPPETPLLCSFPPFRPRPSGSRQVFSPVLLRYFFFVQAEFLLTRRCAYCRLSFFPYFTLGVVIDFFSLRPFVCEISFRFKFYPLRVQCLQVGVFIFLTVPSPSFLSTRRGLSFSPVFPV